MDSQKLNILFVEKEKKKHKELEKLQEIRKSDRNKKMDPLQDKESSTRHSDEEIKFLRSENKRLCTENKRLCKENKRLCLPNERLMSKYLDLDEKYERVRVECSMLKKYYEILGKQVVDAGLTDGVNSRNDFTVMSTTAITSSSHDACDVEVVYTEETNCKGMLRFRKEDIETIIQHLVIDLKPHIALRLLNDLPAYILFMCIKYTDALNDDDALKSLMTTYLKEVTRVVKDRNDVETSALWLNNTLRLLNHMKQYSGDKLFQIQNTPRQNRKCLRNFNLSKYQVALNGNALYIFNGIVNQLTQSIQALTVPALLENEAMFCGLSLNNTGKMWSSFLGGQREATQQKLNKLLSELSLANEALQHHGIHHDIIVQLFKHVFYFICATTLNKLLSQNQLCQWTKGIQIRRNLSHLELWAKNHQLVPATEELEPIIQAVELLQSPKSDDNASSICEMCNKLNANQITNILYTYTPADEDDGIVPYSFINLVQTKLEERGMDDEQYFKPLECPYVAEFPFDPSNIQLEDIYIPEILNLPMLKKI